MKGQERRKSPRHPILESFSLFAVVPSKGPYRLPVHDVSDTGLGFDFDMEGEDTSLTHIKLGDQFALHLYLNQTLYLPLKGKAMRVEERGGVRKVGMEVLKDSPGLKAFQSFVKVIDGMSDVAVLDTSKS